MAIFSIPLFYISSAAAVVGLLAILFLIPALSLFILLKIVNWFLFRRFKMLITFKRLRFSLLRGSIHVQDLKLVTRDFSVHVVSARLHYRWWAQSSSELTPDDVRQNVQVRKPRVEAHLSGVEGYIYNATGKYDLLERVIDEALSGFSMTMGTDIRPQPKPRSDLPLFLRILPVCHVEIKKGTLTVGNPELETYVRLWSPDWILRHALAPPTHPCDLALSVTHLTVQEPELKLFRNTEVATTNEAPVRQEVFDSAQESFRNFFKHMAGIIEPEDTSAPVPVLSQQGVAKIAQRRPRHWIFRIRPVRSLLGRKTGPGTGAVVEEETSDRQWSRHGVLEWAMEGLVTMDNLSAVYTVDLLGIHDPALPDTREDRARPTNRAALTASSLVATFGPWADRQRRQHMAFFFPHDYLPRLTIADLGKGLRARRHLGLDLHVTLASESRLVVPCRGIVDVDPSVFYNNTAQPVSTQRMVLTAVDAVLSGSFETIGVTDEWQTAFSATLPGVRAGTADIPNATIRAEGAVIEVVQRHARRVYEPTEMTVTTDIHGGKLVYLRQFIDEIRALSKDWSDLGAAKSAAPDTALRQFRPRQVVQVYNLYDTDIMFPSEPSNVLDPRDVGHPTATAMTSLIAPHTTVRVSSDKRKFLPATSAFILTAASDGLCMRVHKPSGAVTPVCECGSMSLSISRRGHVAVRPDNVNMLAVDLKLDRLAVLLAGDTIRSVLNCIQNAWLRTSLPCSEEYFETNGDNNRWPELRATRLARDLAARDMRGDDSPLMNKGRLLFSVVADSPSVTLLLHDAPCLTLTTPDIVASIDRSYNSLDVAVDTSPLVITPAHTSLTHLTVSALAFQFTSLGSPGRAVCLPAQVEADDSRRPNQRTEYYSRYAADVGNITGHVALDDAILMSTAASDFVESFSRERMVRRNSSASVNSDDTVIVNSPEMSFAQLGRPSISIEPKRKRLRPMDGSVTVGRTSVALIVEQHQAVAYLVNADIGGGAAVDITAVMSKDASKTVRAAVPDARLTILSPRSGDDFVTVADMELGGTVHLETLLPGHSSAMKAQQAFLAFHDQIWSRLVPLDADDDDTESFMSACSDVDTPCPPCLYRPDGLPRAKLRLHNRNRGFNRTAAVTFVLPPPPVVNEVPSPPNTAKTVPMLQRIPQIDPTACPDEAPPDTVECPPPGPKRTRVAVELEVCSVSATPPAIAIAIDLAGRLPRGPGELPDDDEDDEDPSVRIVHVSAPIAVRVDMRLDDGPSIGESLTAPTSDLILMQGRELTLKATVPALVLTGHQAEPTSAVETHRLVIAHPTLTLQKADRIAAAVNVRTVDISATAAAANAVALAKYVALAVSLSRDGGAVSDPAFLDVSAHVGSISARYADENGVVGCRMGPLAVAARGRELINADVRLDSAVIDSDISTAPQFATQLRKCSTPTKADLYDELGLVQRPSAVMLSPLTAKTPKPTTDGVGRELCLTGQIGRVEVATASRVTAEAAPFDVSVQAGMEAVSVVVTAGTMSAAMKGLADLSVTRPALFVAVTRHPSLLATCGVTVAGVDVDLPEVLCLPGAKKAVAVPATLTTSKTIAVPAIFSRVPATLTADIARVAVNHTRGPVSLAVVVPGISAAVSASKAVRVVTTVRGLELSGVTPTGKVYLPLPGLRVVGLLEASGVPALAVEADHIQLSLPVAVLSELLVLSRSLPRIETDHVPRRRKTRRPSRTMNLPMALSAVTRGCTLTLALPGAIATVAVGDARAVVDPRDKRAAFELPSIALALHNHIGPVPRLVDPVPTMLADQSGFTVECGEEVALTSVSAWLHTSATGSVMASVAGIHADAVVAETAVVVHPVVLRLVDSALPAVLEAIEGTKAVRPRQINKTLRRARRSTASWALEVNSVAARILSGAGDDAVLTIPGCGISGTLGGANGLVTAHRVSLRDVELALVKTNAPDPVASMTAPVVAVEVGASLTAESVAVAVTFAVPERPRCIFSAAAVGAGLRAVQAWVGIERSARAPSGGSVSSVDSPTSPRGLQAELTCMIAGFEFTAVHSDTAGPLFTLMAPDVSVDGRYVSEAATLFSPGEVFVLCDVATTHNDVPSSLFIFLAQVRAELAALAQAAKGKKVARLEAATHAADDASSSIANKRVTAVLTIQPQSVTLVSGEYSTVNLQLGTRLPLQASATQSFPNGVRLVSVALMLPHLFSRVARAGEVAVRTVFDKPLSLDLIGLTLSLAASMPTGVPPFVSVSFDLERLDSVLNVAMLDEVFNLYRTWTAQLSAMRSFADESASATGTGTSTHSATAEEGQGGSSAVFCLLANVHKAELRVNLIDGFGHTKIAADGAIIRVSSPNVRGRPLVLDSDVREASLATEFTGMSSSPTIVTIAGTPEFPGLSAHGMTIRDFRQLGFRLLVNRLAVDGGELQSADVCDLSFTLVTIPNDGTTAFRSDIQIGRANAEATTVSASAIAGAVSSLSRTIRQKIAAGKSDRAKKPRHRRMKTRVKQPPMCEGRMTLSVGILSLGLFENSRANPTSIRLASEQLELSFSQVVRTAPTASVNTQLQMTTARSFLEHVTVSQAKGRASKSHSILIFRVASDAEQTRPSASFITQRELGARELGVYFLSHFPQPIFVTLNGGSYTLLRRIITLLGSDLKAQFRRDEPVAVARMEREYDNKRFVLSPQLEVLGDLTPSTGWVLGKLGLDPDGNQLQAAMHEHVVIYLEKILGVVNVGINVVQGRLR
ncbi:hypothetical protein J8273_5020 [Carpediemonas membranifera]|uniref:Uncharacterized protein n=1 Tax=Carpediemonas membranifera TaxID=201153 RepID=A0A8J6E1I8_9EUKA|nr:hypothetical protein J8273_5020 [Carpediemonas membranifera]|eukprot:KAG9393533.1 hypothetical protein J8273_5020 [Carpediemonas membranifera]